ncbi:MAG: rhodanese-like domain-containing protein [Pelolinea sp.]|nr:rhodanese-like domain-containing protein [Pelolinea sp.]
MKKIVFLILILILAACRQKVSPTINTAATSKAANYQMISVDELSQAMKNKDFLLVNVHVPVEGNIPGTDMDIAYDKIEKQIDKFPEDKNAKIILYCRSGAMGNTAAKALANLGYTNVFNLEGGYDTWEKAGYQFPEE